MGVVFFGLWTALGAGAPGDCGTFTRAKQSALLFDRLLFEGGSLALQLEGEDVAERWLRPLAPGSGPLRAWERGPGAGGSLPGPVVSFDALLDSLRLMDVDWAGVVVPPHDDAARALVTAGEQSGLTPSSAWLGHALHRDLVVARRLGAALTPTPVFAPLIFPEANSAPMTRAIVSPDPARLVWEDVLRLRDDGSVRAARRLMLETLALHKPDDSHAMLSTLDVLAEDIGGLLTDAFESVETDPRDLIVTRVAASANSATTSEGGPVILMETHSTARPA